MPTEPAEEAQHAMTTELTIVIDASPELVTSDLRHQIKCAAKAVAVAFGIVGLTDDFEKRRDELVAAGEIFTKPPADDAEQEDMLSAQRDLAGFRIAVTKEEAVLKGPLNTVKTKVIELTKTGLAPVERTEKHIQGLVNRRQQILLEERQKREADAERERQRVANETAAAQRALDEAERQRQAAEHAKEAAAALEGEEQRAALAAAAELTSQAQAAEEAAFEASIAAESAPKPPVVPVSELPTARPFKDYELIGADVFKQKESLLAFAVAHPRLVNIEIRRRDLLDELNENRITEAPGIKIKTALSNLR